MPAHANENRYRDRLVACLAAAGASRRSIGNEVGLSAGHVARIARRSGPPDLSAGELAAEIEELRRLRAIVGVTEGAL